eukprot:TRINITY_DN11629_c0_g1_i2.p1 TRINITY_DN11629_c0_g1~~TRINITY_DN11629_c0_g1_i2.p1  ORF type:complete len:1000 (-),score=269.53 TRINITY_DN11629_c0_g1_i2:174-3173(-)
MQANAADEELGQLLQALSSADKATRTAAEEALERSRGQPGFVSRVAVFGAGGSCGSSATAPEVFPLRQLALTILKKTANEYWTHVPAADQASLKQTLLAAIAEENSNLRGLLHACAAAARSRGDWPEMHAQLQAGLERGSAREAECCVECIVMLLDDCGPNVGKELAPLQGQMLRLASSDTSPPILRRHCVTAHVAAVQSVLSDCFGHEVPAATLEAVAAGLPAWFNVGAALCTGVDSWSDADRVSCAFTAVRAATTLSRFRPLDAALAGLVETVLRPACLLLQKMQPVYEQSVIFQDDGGASEEDGNMAPFVAQVMELIQAMLARPKLRASLKGHIKHLLQLLVPFLRITEAQVASWRADPNEFLAHEDDEHARGCLVRLSGEGLLDELLEHVKREALKAVASICAELLEVGERGRTSGTDPGAWKLSEVSLLLFGNVASEVQVRSLQKNELAPLVPVALAAAGRLCSDTSVPEFLRARAFAILRKMGDAVCKLSAGDVPGLLEAAAAGLAPSQPLVVRVSALRTFCRFLSATESSIKEKLLLEKGVLTSLAGLVRQADEELLHLTLESLTLIVRQCPGAMTSVDDSFAKLVVEMWRRCSGDAMVHLQVLDLVSCATAADPKLQGMLEAALVPLVAENLQPDKDQREAASAVELLSILVKRSQVPVAAPLWSCVQGICPLVMRSGESLLLQNACDALCCVIRRSPKQFGDLLAPALQCVERFLGPDLDDDGCLFVGPFLMLLLSQYGSALSADLTSGLLRAVVLRLSRADRPYLRQELLTVLARLVLEDCSGVLGVLSGFQVPLDGASRNGFEFFISFWMAQTKEIRGRRAKNTTVSAMCRIHERCAQDASLGNLQLTPGDPPLKDKLLEKLLECLEMDNDRCKTLRENPGGRGKGDYVSEDDDDDADDDDEADIGEGSLGKLLSELVDFGDGSEDEEDDEEGGEAVEELGPPDPLASLNLRVATAEYLAKYAGAGGAPAALSGRIAAAVADVQAHPQ